MTSKSRTLIEWIRALDDVQVIRVDFDCAALHEVWNLGLIDFVPVKSRENAVDARLSMEGKRSATVACLRQ